MSTDVRDLDPAAYTIFTNAAVLPVSQDPLGKSTSQIWRRKIAGDANEYGIQSELSLWIGSLWGGDHIVAFMNPGSRSN